jgi:hypothetical protein
MKIKLPAQLNPISRRKDRSVKLSFETRELTPSETMTLMSLEGVEGWLVYAPNDSDIDDSDVPNAKAEVGIKSASERLRAVIFIWFKQETEKGSYVGLFDTFLKEKMEKIIEGVKSKLDQ